MVSTWQVAHPGPHPLFPQGVLPPPHFLSDILAGYAPTSRPAPCISRDQPELAKQPYPGGHPARPCAPHQVGEIRPRVEFLGLLAGGDVRQLLQAEELWDVNDVPLHQAQLPPQDVTVQVNALLWGGKGQESEFIRNRG